VANPSRICLPTLLLLAASLASAEEPWTTYAVKEGITLEKRPVPGSKYYEYRATTMIRASTQTVLAGIWGGVLDPPTTVRKRTVLRHSEDEMLVYDQIKTPVVSDRDVTIDIRKSALAGGVVEVRFESHNELGPPPDPKYVRIPTVRGGWRAEPSGPSASRIIYQCYSEPGGSLPAFLIRGAQQDQVLVDVKRILDRLHASEGSPAAP
jgi:hypothetical protein